MERRSLYTATVLVIAALVVLSDSLGSERPRSVRSLASTTLVLPRSSSHFSRAHAQRTYYVSPSGNDHNSGTSRARPWRTIARVNSAGLNPGDLVRFRGRSHFDDKDLTPRRSGASSRPVTYSSYGRGRAIIGKGILLTGVAWLRITRLVVSGAAQGVSSGSSGGGVHDIVIDRSSFIDVEIGINSGSKADQRWLVKNNLIQRTGDSGIIVIGHDVRISHNRIIDTGIDSSIAYGKHAVYAKGSDIRVTDNVIRDFHDDGVSNRFHNAVVKGNLISGGSIGIAWFQNDDQAGTTHWEGNRVLGTTTAGLYVSPSDEAGPTSESFVIKRNRIARKSGVYMDLRPTKGTYRVCCNHLGR